MNEEVGDVDDGFFIPDRVMVIVWGGIVELVELRDERVILFYWVLKVHWALIEIPVLVPVRVAHVGEATLTLTVGGNTIFILPVEESGSRVVITIVYVVTAFTALVVIDDVAVNVLAVAVRLVVPCIFLCPPRQKVRTKLSVG